MPKIRGVKPDYWTDEGVVELSIPARLLFIGLWNYACDNGHVQDKSKQIKMRVLPTDEVNCAELLREIETQGLIQRADGWITIPNLSHHQKPHKRWYVTCEKPGCEMPEGASYGFSKRESTVDQPLTNGGTTVNNGGSTADVDGDVDVDGEGERTPKPRKRATQLPDGFQPNESNIQLAVSEGVDLRREFVKFCDYNRSKGSTYKDWHLALNNWIRKAAEYGGNVRPLRPEPQQDEQGRLVLPPLPSQNEWSGR